MRRGLTLKEECEIKRKEAEEENKMSRERGRGGGMRDRGRGAVNNRTDSEDPKLLNARVFIGNLATDKTSRMELEEMFSKYGTVLGITMFRGYGFVQFERQMDALLAVERENGGLYKGQRMDIKMAAEGRNKQDGRDGEGRGRGRGRGGRFSPPPPKARRLDPEFDDLGARRPPRDDPYAEDPYRRGPPGRDPFLERARRDDPYRHDPFLPDPYRDPYREPLPPPGVEPPPIDCVIFTLGRHLEPYAESIVRRLHAFGILASILPLTDETSIKPAMEDVTQRGSPFAIVLNDQNETHQSCTVSILHGVAQEHRNMPLEDALNLVDRSFQQFIKDEKAKAKDPSNNYKHLPPGEQMQYLLNLLADNHYLSVDELTKVITYLEDRKKKVIAHEMGPNAVAVEQEKNINKQQQELQAKILSILGPDAQTGEAPPVPAPQPLAPPAYSMANSPRVQQAIDTLMQSGSNLLQNISSEVNPPLPPEPQYNQYMAPSLPPQHEPVGYPGYQY